jgi:hypothetical protein
MISGLVWQAMCCIGLGVTCLFGCSCRWIVRWMDNNDGYEQLVAPLGKVRSLTMRGWLAWRLLTCDQQTGTRCEQRISWQVEEGGLLHRQGLRPVPSLICLHTLYACMCHRPGRSRCPGSQGPPTPSTSRCVHGQLAGARRIWLHAGVTSCGITYFWGAS